PYSLPGLDRRVHHPVQVVWGLNCSQAAEKHEFRIRAFALARPKALRNQTPLQGRGIESRLFPQPTKGQIAKGKNAQGALPLFHFRARSANFRNLIVELVENADGGVKNLLIHLTIRSDGFRQRYGNNLVPPQRRHLPEFAAVHHVDGAQSIARGQYAVVSAGRSAPLDVPEYNR